MGKKDIERTTRKKQNNRDGVDSRSGSRGAAGKGGRGVRAELVFILDASGSMAGLESDTIGGFNALIEENREKSGEASVSLVQFNDRSKVVLDRVPIEKVPRLTRSTYRCRGCTALLDAVGAAIEHIDLVQRVQPAGYEADRVLFVITTDGMENASRRFGYRRVRHLIRKHREMGWEFLFIGANIDVEHEAESLGLDPDMAVEYIADDIGTGALYEAASIATATVRAGASMTSGAWRAGIDEDRRRRGRS
ncbi:vWA domain-containing protein [Collinsella intestinalis]|uniref:vWA domain-containing protein n=1 Tax=Collinsella intestinalis TaxID=147207 RepID=UPI0025A4442E|nr:vWA domain-containing protein [Collinsella intestinalis]MDM8163458.1 VWA domain-containing protein [Collinsella intestinalis]